MLELEGVITGIRFRNEGNGWTVATLETEDGAVTIVGTIPMLNLEERVQVCGEWNYHETFGEQLSIESVRVLKPSTLQGIENYLSSGLIPYIGKKTAKQIVEKFGLETLEILETQPDRLKELDGIGDKKLQSIKEAFREQFELREVLVFLQQFGIGSALAMKIYRKYGAETARVVSANPYILCEDIQGVGFKKADEIAQKMGFSLVSSERAEAALRYVLMMSAQDGHCFLYWDDLSELAGRLLSVSEEIVEQAIRTLALKDQFYILPEGDRHLVYHRTFQLAENQSAVRLTRLMDTEFKEKDMDFSTVIAAVEERHGLEFAPRQRDAIAQSVKSGVTVITGGPGTGKTTVIKGIIEIAEQLGLSFELAAPTGRAAKRMTEATGYEARTIHRLLEYSFGEESVYFGRDEDNPIETDLLIVDEASMIDILLLRSLLQAIRIGTRLILVGDVDQLPSVGPGNVLKDIIQSEQVPVVALREIFRQAEESMIVVNAHRINEGELPILNAREKDFFFLHRSDGEKIAEEILRLIAERLPAFYRLDPLRDIQVLAPMKKGATGIVELNRRLQASLNPPSEEKEEKMVGDDIFRVGDKVMQVKNNYTLKWKVRTETGEMEGEGVFNGDFGFIVRIDSDERVLEVLFDEEKSVEYEFGSLDELKLAYAITVHKSQGSEFPCVVMPILGGPPLLLNRNLLYTAITRAKQLVVLVGLEPWVKRMVDNNSIRERNSRLDRKLAELGSVRGL